MAVSFRNVDVDPAAPVETWPFEAIVTVIERESLDDRIPLMRAIGADPWGVVARQVEEYLADERPYGVAPLLERRIADARAEAAAAERAEVAAEITRLVAESGLTLGEFADRIGTSASRLSTYRSGRVVPSAALLVRMRHASARARDRP